MNELDLLDEILPANPQRRWVDHHQERRGADRTRPSPNGHARGFTHVCAGCGREFDSNRRQILGRKSWCGRPECKKIAAAERAHEYRSRKESK